MYIDEQTPSEDVGHEKYLEFISELEVLITRYWCDEFLSVPGNCSLAMTKSGYDISRIIKYRLASCDCVLTTCMREAISKSGQIAESSRRADLMADLRF